MATKEAKTEEMNNSFDAKFLRVQCGLTVKKDKQCQFGSKFVYRTAEGIMEALKPLFQREQLVGFFHSEKIIDGVFHSEFTIRDFSGNGITTQHETPVDSDLRGMSRGQMGGATASYCRKYLLCGLFMIDGGDHDLDERDQAGDIEAAIMSAESVEVLTKIYYSQKSFLQSRPDFMQKLAAKKQELMNANK